MQANYINHMGDDLSVVNAARVSFAKESDWEPFDTITDPSGAFTIGYGERLNEQDTKLIRYLAKHKHFSPFNHSFITIRVKAPIFVARQLQKHEYMPWNEVSRRYVDSPPEFYYPNWRERADNVKQGSGSTLEDAKQEAIWYSYDESIQVALETYLDLVNFYKVSPEQARMVLPQSMYTEWYWSGTLKAWAKMCKLRLDKHSQQETREVAQMCSNIIAPLFPVAWEALLNSNIE